MNDDFKGHIKEEMNNSQIKKKHEPEGDEVFNFITEVKVQITLV